ncbi:MAG: flagellar hook-basal body complex protein FliE [Treponema sp.]|nr:flagellar hook-basal body complex protein FliE [Treponema sp.]
MKIAEFGTLQMVRTDAQHFGNGKIIPLTANKPGMEPISKISGLTGNSKAASITPAENSKSFQDYLIEAVNTVNNQQNEVSNIQERLITDPDSVDVHDVTIAMSKARMSLNLAQTVIDRLVTDWNEITTTR